MRFLLSPHAWLIAAIFIPYMAFMVGLGAYIVRTGQRRRDDDPQDPPGPAFARA